MSEDLRGKKKVAIREIKVNDRGVKYTAIMCRWSQDGKDKRKRFKNLEEANTFAQLKEIELSNEEVKLDRVVTRLTQEQVQEAEGVFQSLGDRYSLREAVDYFLRHFSRPDFRITIGEAVRQFLEGKERDGVRARSIKQLESTMRQFEAFALIHLLSDGERMAIESARGRLTQEKAALPEEIARRMKQSFRAEFREIARSVGEESRAAVPRIFAKLSKATRNAAADARDGIESNRAPHDWEVVESARGSLPEPFLHDVDTAMIEAFLRSLRGKDGYSQASPKTWNNTRADIHSFCAWCGDPRRRWIGDNPAKTIKKLKVSRGVPDVLTVGQVEELMQYVAGLEGGKLVHYFALALFAGLRTGEGGELHKLAKHPDKSKLIDLAHGVIHIQPEISKTGHYRQIEIRPNLLRWLMDYPAEVLPVNHSRLVKAIRAKFKLSHDVLRHTFFSMHIAAFDSIGRAALEGGNTEGIIRRHYLNMASEPEGRKFWKITPSSEKKIINIA